MTDVRSTSIFTGTPRVPTRAPTTLTQATSLTQTATQTLDTLKK